MNTYNITLVGVHYKVEDTASGDAYYFPRQSAVLRTNGDLVLIENATGGARLVGLKSHPFTSVEVGGAVQASAQATIDAIAALS